MPSLSQIRSLTAPVGIDLGSVKITLQPLLERISPVDETWARLLEVEEKARGEFTALMEQLGELAKKSGELLEPAPDRVTVLRETIALHLVAIGAHIVPDDPDLTAARESLSEALNELEAFEMELSPSAAEMEKRASGIEESAEGIQKEIEAATEAIISSRLERLVYLLDHPSGWDLTEGEGEDVKPWPATKENIKAVPLLEKAWPLMLDECEKAVEGFLAQPSNGGNSLPG